MSNIRARHDFRLQVDPGAGIGPIRLGMTRPEAIAACERMGFATSSDERWPGRPDSLFAGTQLQAHFDRSECVVEIEAARPRLPEDVPVYWRQVDLFGDAQFVIDSVAAVADPDKSHRDYPHLAQFPTLGLSLWRDAKPEQALAGHYEAVGIFRPKNAG